MFFVLATCAVVVVFYLLIEWVYQALGSAFVWRSWCYEAVCFLGLGLLLSGIDRSIEAFFYDAVGYTGGRDGDSATFWIAYVLGVLYLKLVHFYEINDRADFSVASTIILAGIIVPGLLIR